RFDDVSQADAFDGGQALRQRGIQVLKQPAPALAHASQGGESVFPAACEDFFAGVLEVVDVDLAHGKIALQKGFDFIEQAQFVAGGQLDVDALDGVRVFAHAIERNHDVFVDLEGVGVACDGGRAGTIEPEFLASFRGDGDKALAVPAVGNAHDFAGGHGDGVFVIADDVADEHHFWQDAALALGGIAHGTEITFVQVFQAGQQGTAFAARAVQVFLDLDDGGYGVACLPEEFHAHGAGVGRHAVNDPARGGDQAVAAFLLHPRQTGKEFVGDVLAQTDLAEALAFD